MTDAEQQETAVNGEVEQTRYRFNEVHLGHRWEDVDADQVFALKIAAMAGLLDISKTSFHFSPIIADADLRNNDSLNLEGFKVAKTRTDPTMKDANKPGSNNFANDPSSDKPAAAMLFEAYHREFDELPIDIKEKAQDLKNWLSAVERGEPIPSLQRLRVNDLAMFTKIFYAIKHDIAVNRHGNKERDLITEVNGLFNLILNTDRTESLEITYGRQLAAFTEFRNQKTQALRERLVLRNEANEEIGINPRYLRTTRTMQGLQLTYVDVSGLELDAGTFGLAAQLVRDFKKVDTDIVMLVDDELDASGEAHGKQIKIKIDKSRRDMEHLRHIDLRDLAIKLNVSEQLFGGGVQVIQTADFDGHPQIIGSPQGEGSQLDPEDVYIALQNYFNYPRYRGNLDVPEQQRQKERRTMTFAQRAREFAQRIGIDQYVDQGVVTPKDPYHIVEHVFDARIPTNGENTGLVAVAIPEHDLALYEAVFTDDIVFNRSIVSAWTEVSEHELITQKREERALQEINRYIEEDNAPMVLELLDNLNQESIRSLPLETLLRIIEAISHDEAAISQVWDKNNLRFRIFGQNLPEWIQQNIVHYKGARYSFQTVSSKVDTVIENKLHSAVADADTATQARYASVMQRILLSHAYIRSHTGESYDNHLHAVLRILADERFDASIRNELASAIAESYGEPMAKHWKRIEAANPDLMLAAMVNSPQFDRFRTDLHLQPEAYERIPNVAGSEVISPHKETVEQHLYEQARQGLSPVMTLLVEIGGRPCLSSIEKQTYLLLL